MTTKKGCGLHCIKMKHIGVQIGEQVILEDVNVHIHCGSLTAIIGRNGAGKSTLLKAILGEIAHEGTIEFTDLKEGGIKHLTIGYVPQTVMVDKNTPTSVYDMMAGFVSRCPVFLLKSKTVERKIKEQLSLFGAEELIDKAVCDLSGGQLQRVLLSLAVMPDIHKQVPRLLLLDEPVAGIDQNGIRQFYDTIDHIKEIYDLAIILVSHDLEYVKEYADSVLLLDKTILAQGSPLEVFSSQAYEEMFGIKRMEGKN